MKTLITNVRIVDTHKEVRGHILLERGTIQALYDTIPHDHGGDSVLYLNGRELGNDVVCMPSFVDLHAHLRDPGFPSKETLESGFLAAAAGGYGTVVCMANTDPPLDSLEGALNLYYRAQEAGIIDLFPVLSLTKGMEGISTQHLEDLQGPSLYPAVRMLSEDGKDIQDDAVLCQALHQAHRLGIPVSYHCEVGGKEVATLKDQGAPREIWSRIEENHGTRRVLDLAISEGSRIHIAHVSTKEALGTIVEYRQRFPLVAEAIPQKGGVLPTPGPRAGLSSKGLSSLTCEVTPHHLALTEERARHLGAESYGRVNPPLRKEEDRQALIEALCKGYIDAIATDHAPHTDKDKAQGAPGFIGLETAFPVCYTTLVRPGYIGLSALSSLMSYKPAQMLGINDRGLVEPGFQADLVLVDVGRTEFIGERPFKSRSKNSPFIGMEMQGVILFTFHRGRLVYQRQE